MTNKDVLIQILSEVSGKPKSEVESLFENIKGNMPLGNKMDKELSDQDAEKLLSNLRKEKSGIMDWLIQGAKVMDKKTGHA